MKKWVLIAAVLAAASAVGDELEDFVHKEREARQIPGLVVATIKNGEIDRVVSSGKASLDLDVPVKRATAFEIGSMTKAFTAEVVMMLVEEGKVALSDPVAKYIEGSPDTWKNITIRHLLTHTSGLPNYTSIRPALIVNGQKLTFDDLMTMVKDLKLVFEPGSKYMYSNTNYYFLGKVIEMVTGSTYPEFLRDRILTPLDMKDTVPQKPRGIIKNRAVGHMMIGSSHSIMPYLDPTGASAAGFLVSTVDDLAKWDKALLQGKLLKPESYAAMYKSVAIDDGISTYGFGWDISQMAGHKVIQHGGGTGGFSTYMLRLPDDKVTVVVLGNLAQADVGSIAKGVARMLIPSLIEKAIRDPDPTLTKSHRDLVDKILDGTVQRSAFEEKTANELFPTLIAQARQHLLSLGKLTKFEVLEHKNEPSGLARKYRVTFEKGIVALTIRTNREGKIVAIFYQPD
ncbi:MAG: beta-lactamase family protein [Armatimonadota bacterium]|nr:beta-lactamase family protein [Armatimonadota bacterium]